MTNFPLSASVGQIHEINGFNWQWDGIAWNSYYSTLQQAIQAYSVDEKTTSYTLALSDQGKVIQMNASTALTVTVPVNSTAAFPIGTQITVVRKGTGTLTISPVSGSVTINATPGYKLRAQWSTATLVKVDTDVWILAGDLTV